MLIAPMYAILIWFAAMRWRRQFAGFAAVTIGAGIVGVLDLALSSADPHTPASSGLFSIIHSELFIVLLRPYALLIAAVGFYIAFLPKRPPSEAHCPRCFYDLSGLDPRGLVCPECGETPAYRCAACDHDFGGTDPVRLVCPDCGAWYRGPGSRPEALARAAQAA